MPNNVSLAKKYNVNVKKLKEKGDIEFQKSQDYSGRWKLVSKKKPEEVFEWRKLKQEEFEKRVKDIFTSKGYLVRKAEELNLTGYYVITKDNKKTLIKCNNSNIMPTVDEIRALYGLKDFYEVNDVILVGVSAISKSAKDYIDQINLGKESQHTYKFLSIDSIIDSYNKIRKNI